MAVDAARTFEIFSVSHAAVLSPDQTEAAGSGYYEEEFGDIPTVRTASLAPDSGNFDNTGDDIVKSTWFWLNFVNLTVEGGHLSMELIALLQGDSVTSGTDTYSVPLWSICSLNTPPRPVLVRSPARDSDGFPFYADFLLYRVHFAPIGFTGPAYKTGATVNYTGRAVIADKDERGDPLEGRDRACARLIAVTAADCA